ncbi:MAG: NAD(P)/FAD-dependent oxidoreductase [Calditerrivibrio sp.]|nr:NAD(P)/FAD-dependent oxidoreductase [Calditerrivibrio sp.]
MPPDTSKIEIVVIGAGPAGVSTAIELAKAGKKVAIIDKDINSSIKLSGSTVSNTLLYLSYLYNRLKTKTSHFITYNTETVPEPIFDLKKMRKYIENASSKIFKAYKDDLNDYNVLQIEGTASFTSRHSITIIHSNKKSEELNFDKAIIATGSYPKTLPFAAGKKHLDPLNIINMEKIPTSITIIGGGFIGIEYATFFKRIGCHVTVVESKDKILYTFDDYITKKCEEMLKKDGINIIKEKTVTNIERIGNKTLIFLDNEKIQSDEVFIAVGRLPNIKNLSLESAGVALENDLPVIEKTLNSTTNKDIYFVGDAAGKFMFLNWAYLSSEIVVKSILGKSDDNINFIFPKVLYIDPEIASVGLTEQEAISKKYSIQTIKYSFSDLEMSIITGHSKGSIKVIIEKNTKKVLGAHIIGKGANELLPIFSLIIKMKLNLDEISKHIFSYPTFVEALVDIGNKIRN